MENVYKTVGFLVAAALVAAEATAHYLTGWPVRHLDPVVMLIGGLIFAFLLGWRERKTPVLWAAAFTAYYGFFLHFLAGPHPVTVNLIKAYWLWWVVLLAAASAVEGAGTSRAKKLGAPDWKHYPFCWGPSHQAVMLPVWWVVSVDILAKWGSFCRDVVLGIRKIPFGLENQAFVSMWAIHGETTAAMLSSLIPILTLLAIYLVVGNAAIRAVRLRLATEY